MELDMTKGSPLPLILRFSIPIVLGNIFQQFYNMVDTIIVGRFVGVDALAAVGATGSIMFLVIGFVQGITAGFAVVTSHFFGAGDKIAVKKSVGNGALLCLGISVLLALLSFLGLKPLLMWMNTPEDIFHMSYVYIMIICVGAISSIVYNYTAGILRAVGNSKIPLVFLLIAAGFNLILDILFVAVLHMGVAGAAWATVLSQGISGLMCICYIMKHMPSLCCDMSDFRLESVCSRKQLYIGIPMALQYSITAIGVMYVQSVLNRFGSVAVAAYTAASKLEMILNQFFNGFGMTMATYGAQNTGIGAYGRIRKGARWIAGIDAFFALAFLFLFRFSLPYGLGLFVTGDATPLMGFAQSYVHICTMFYFPLAMIFLFRNLLQGCGYSILPMLGGVVELLSRVGTSLVALKYMSYEGVCYANAAAWTIGGCFFVISYFFTIVKKERRLD